MNNREADYFKKSENGVLICTLCPHSCRIPPGEMGICWGKKNENGKLIACNYGETTSLAVDPIEKKPLYHFKPGTQILSVSPNGCNMRCPYCQNYTISARESNTYYIGPEELVKKALEHNCPSIAFTYSEPVIWFEYIMDVAKFSKPEDIKLVMVTNGLINEEPLNDILKVVDAMNIDLKSMDEEYYRKVLKGDLKTTLNTIEQASRKIHVEVTNLLIPGDNDSDVDKMVKWISGIDKNIPLHISRYFPYLDYDRPPTPIEMLKSAYDKASEFLDYVYIGNAPISGTENTKCPSCSQLLIRRTGYRTEVRGIDNGKCIQCGRKADIVL